MFLRRKSRLEELLSRIEPLKTESFLEVKGLSGRIAPDKLRYSNGNYVSCVSFPEAQLLTRELSNGIKVRLPSLEEDYMAFKRLDDKYKETVLSSPPEWKAEYVDGSFMMINPEVRKVDMPREYEFFIPSHPSSGIGFVIYNLFEDFRENIQWLGLNRDKYDRAAVVRTKNYENGGDIYAACMTPPLSKDMIGLRLLAEE
ncbi:MAG: hypothetical protein ABIE55_00370 [Candidatus Aenigmatarchaeota archaeon]